MRRFPLGLCLGVVVGVGAGCGADASAVTDAGADADSGGATSQDSAPQDSAPQDSVSQDSVSQDTADANAGDSAATAPDATVQETAGADTSVRDRTFTVARVSGFAIRGGIPNATWLARESQVVLIYSNGGLVEATSPDGVNFTNLGVVDAGLTGLLGGGIVAVDMLVREVPGGRRYFALGLPAPGVKTRDLYAADLPDGGSLALVNGGAPVYSGGAVDGHSLGVPDIFPIPGGAWRMLYVSPYSGNGNCSSAVSSDSGATWTFESDNPFADASASGAANINVDPGPLALADGSYMAVAMRATELFFWNSDDGATWTQVPDFRVGAGMFAAEAPGAKGLFDPTLVQLPNGTIYMYVTAGGGPQGDKIVAATVTPD